MNASECLKNVRSCIKELEDMHGKNNSNPYNGRYKRIRLNDYTYAFTIRTVCDELGIFDWWNETLSINQLKQMESFLKNAIKLGFDKYVCFKVGASGCSHGMWAHKDESTDGYSPDGDCIFHSFRSGDNYFSACLNGEWIHKDMNLKQLKEAVKEAYNETN